MGRFAWIWAAGTVAWIADGLVSLHFHNRLRAELAFLVAAMFFIAWLFYRKTDTRR
jgi:hypothetical protein